MPFLGQAAQMFDRSCLYPVPGFLCNLCLPTPSLPILDNLKYRHNHNVGDSRGGQPCHLLSLQGLWVPVGEDVRSPKDKGWSVRGKATPSPPRFGGQACQCRAMVAESGGTEEVTCQQFLIITGEPVKTPSSQPNPQDSDLRGFGCSLNIRTSSPLPRVPQTGSDTFLEFSYFRLQRKHSIIPHPTASFSAT